MQEYDTTGPPRGEAYLRNGSPVAGREVGIAQCEEEIVAAEDRDGAMRRAGDTIIAFRTAEVGGQIEIGGERRESARKVVATEGKR